MIATQRTSGILGSDSSTGTPLLVESGNPVLIHGITLTQNSNTVNVVSTLIDLRDNDGNTLIRFMAALRYDLTIVIPFLADNGFEIFWVSGGRPDNVRATVHYKLPGV